MRNRSSRTARCLRARGIPVAAAAQQPKTLRVVMHSDLKILDPVWTTAFIVRNHGYMIYDTLFALDGDLKIKPQMVEKYEVSPDKLTWTFTLRDGLEFHDGQPVTTEDVRGLAEALGRARHAGPDPVGQGGRGQGGRCQDLPARAQGADRRRAAGAGQALGQSLHHAQARRRDAAGRPDQGVRGLRPLHLQGRRMEARRQDRLCQEPQVQAARRAGLGPGRRQARQGRPRRVAGDARPADRGQRAAGGRDRHHRDAAARPLPDPEEGQERRRWSPPTSGATSTSSASTSSTSRSTIPRSARPCSTASTRRTS